jgi:iron complex outermembrane receptor protein
VTQGLEGESNISFSHGLGLYLNASYNSAKYVGNATVYCNGKSAATCSSSTAALSIPTPSGLWISNSPSDIEAEGLTYQHKGWDAGIFNKRVGTQRLDDSGFHNMASVDPFTLTNLFLNYTIRGGSRFDQTKIRLSFNNIFDEHNLTGDSIATKASALTINANGTTYADPFNATFTSAPVSGADAVSVLPGRSVMLSVTFGYGPKR